MKVVLLTLLLTGPLGLAESPQGNTNQVIDQDLTITAATNPYLLNGALKVSGGRYKTITLGPGVDIRDGHIELGQRGTLDIQGTKTAPVILRNVDISQDLGGHLKAEFAVFDHCNFSKSGWLFASYSTKWEIESSLLYQCGFARLTAVDYGIKFRRCAFVSMRFPEVGSHHAKNEPFDHMKALRVAWRTIENCKFVDCEIPPTLFWCSQFGDYFNCGFVSGEPFESDTKTELLAYIVGTAGPSPEEAWAQKPALRAPVTVKLRAAPFDSANPSPVCPIDAISGDANLVAEIWHKPGDNVANAVSGMAGAKETAVMTKAAASPAAAPAGHVQPSILGQSPSRLPTPAHGFSLRWMRRCQPTSARISRCCARVCWTNGRPIREPGGMPTRWGGNFATC